MGEAPRRGEVAGGWLVSGFASTATDIATVEPRCNGADELVIRTSYSQPRKERAFEVQRASALHAADST